MSDWLSPSNTSLLKEIATIIMIEPPEVNISGGYTQTKLKYGSLQQFSDSHDVAENLSDELFTDEYTICKM